MKEALETFKARMQELVNESFGTQEDGTLPFIALFLGSPEEGIGMSSNADKESTLAILAGYVSEATGGVFMFPLHAHNPSGGDPVAQAEEILRTAPQKPLSPGVAPGFVDFTRSELVGQDSDLPAWDNPGTPVEPDPEPHEHDRFSDDGNPHHGE